MRHRVLCILLPVIVLSTGECHAANRTPVTLRAENTSVQPLLRRLLDLGGCSYVIGADVPDGRIRSVAIVDVPFDVALDSLSRSWRFGYTFDDRLCCVTGAGSEIRSSPSGIRDPGRTGPGPTATSPSSDPEKPYYLVRGRTHESTTRISLGPRKPPPATVEPALIEYAGIVSRLVTPEVLDDLALRLRQQVEENPYLRQKLASESMGLTQFRTVNVASKSAAIDVADDLSTSMIRAGFSLVERAQLDKACQELRLQDTGLIDPATAGRLGQMTGCGVIVVGSISDRGDIIVINARLVETATGRALAADRAMVRK